MTLRPGSLLLSLATAGGLALSARALRGHPPPLPLALGFLGGYLALVALGIALPWLRMWGEVVCSVPGARGVALTFEIREVARLQALLPVLRAHKARATFFVPAPLVAQAASLLREAAQAGHDLGLLASPADPWFFARPAERIHDELSRGIDAFQEHLGARPWLLRSCGGRSSPRLVRVASALELTLVGWARGGAELADGVVLRAEAGTKADSPGAPGAAEILGRLAERNLAAVPVTGLLG